MSQEYYLTINIKERYEKDEYLRRKSSYVDVSVYKGSTLLVHISTVPCIIRKRDWSNREGYRGVKMNIFVSENLGEEDVEDVLNMLISSLEDYRILNPEKVALDFLNCPIYFTIVITNRICKDNRLVCVVTGHESGNVYTARVVKSETISFNNGEEVLVVERIEEK